MTAALVGFTMLVTLIVAMVFGRGGIADQKPKPTRNPQG